MNYPLVKSETDNNWQVQHKLFPSLSTHSPAVEFATMGLSNGTQNEKCNTQKDMQGVKENNDVIITQNNNFIVFFNFE